MKDIEKKAKVKHHWKLEAVIIRRNGKREDLGVIAEGVENVDVKRTKVEDNGSHTD